jgi:peptidoglycan/LPS O-acetylase OafA/YrhL
MNRLPGLDLLRAAAILWVMLYHLASYGIGMPGFVDHGWMGVDLFFVLSGYLIGGQLLKPYASGERPRWLAFMARRAFRVLPAYYTVLALYFVLPAFGESDRIAPLWQFLTFTTNLFPDYFHYRAFSHTWSLCVEEHFYLFLPPVVWLIARKPGRGRVLVAAVGVLVCGAALRGWLWQHQVAPYANVHDGPFNFLLRYVEVIYNPTYLRLDGLLAGVMLAAVQWFRPRWWSRAMELAPFSLALGLAGMVACMRLDETSYLGALIAFPSVAFSFACMVVGAASPRTWLGRFAVPGARPVALISFSLYLTHKQVYSLVQALLPPAIEQSDILAFAMFNLAALLAAGLLYVLIERPGLMLRDRVLHALPERVHVALADSDHTAAAQR